MLNTFLSTRVSQLTDADKLGTLFGLFESIEKLAGIGGPLVGGVLAQLDENVPIGAKRHGLSSRLCTGQ